MKAIKLLDKAVIKFQEVILSGSIIVMTIILIGNVIARAIFNNSWSFAEEVGQFLLVFVTFIGTSYASRKGRHIRMTGVFDLMPHMVKKILMITTSLLTSAIMFYLAYYGAGYVLKVKSLGTVSPALRIPLYLIYTVVPIGLTLTGIEYLLNVIKNIISEDVYISVEKEDVSEIF